MLSNDLPCVPLARPWGRFQALDPTCARTPRLLAGPGAVLSWDGKGENAIASNACETSNPAGAGD